MSDATFKLGTQADDILEALQSGDQITPMDALRRWGCFRLGARIWDLKKAGYDIETEMVEHNGKHFARYTLKSAQLRLL